MINYEAGNCTTGNSSNFTACERWIHQDERGSVVATSDTNGAIVETYHYSEYGEPTVASGAEMPFGYTGQRYKPPAPETIRPVDLASAIWTLQPDRPSIEGSLMVT